MSTGQLSTLRQTIPQLWKILSCLQPTFRLDSVAEANAEFIGKHEFRGVLWDVDGTIMAYHGSDVDPAFPHLRSLFANGPARHAILSNCDEPRFDALAIIFPEIPIVRGYATPAGSVFRHKWRGEDTHTADAITAILASGGRQLRKPAGRLVRYTMELLEIDDPAAVLLVGDQYLTDVASANLAGARAAKVPTFRRDTFPLSIRMSQRLEWLLYALGSAIFSSG
ncbi:MAG: HAD hydrolase-like protein [Gemmatimonadales bacterium]